MKTTETSAHRAWERARVAADRAEDAWAQAEYLIAVGCAGSEYADEPARVAVAAAETEMLAAQVADAEDER